LIHSYDFAPLAAMCVETARRYDKIAPEAPHALHMPSHIYSILGMWEDSVHSNVAARKAAEDYWAKNSPGKTCPTASRSSKVITHTPARGLCLPSARRPPHT